MNDQFDLTCWKGCEHPRKTVLEGQFVRLEPLDADKHGDELYEASGEGRTRLMWNDPGTRAEFQVWLNNIQTLKDPVSFAVVDKKTGKVGGRQNFMRIDADHGVLEVGGVLRGPLIAKKPAATEAIFLALRYAFDLGYRRVEWKCHNLNDQSKRAAERFGFKHEGVFRQHFVMKGSNRDTAWYSIIDREWCELRKSYESWLCADNFDENGNQRKKLEEFRKQT